MCTIAHAHLLPVRPLVSLPAVGDPAPVTILIDQAGAEVPLRTLYAERTLVLFFYPKDDSPGCTAEACNFRDRYEEFLTAGADVVGVSADPGSSHARFKSAHRLPFRLLSDPTGAARRAFGVRKTLGLLEGRVTFVIDRGGTIRHVYSSQLRMDAHADEALDVVKGLAR